MKKTTTIVPVLLLVVLLLSFACVSRYKMELFMDTGTETKRVKVEQTEYLMDARIADPYASKKLEPGEGSCIILRTGARGDRVETDMTETLILSYDEYFRCLIYLQLPQPPVVDTMVLERISFAQVLGRYDQPVDTKIFLPERGTIAVDSIVDKKLYGTLDGTYRNNVGTPLNFRGQFRVRIAY